MQSSERHVRRAALVVLAIGIGVGAAGVLGVGGLSLDADSAASAGSAQNASAVATAAPAVTAATPTRTTVDERPTASARTTPTANASGSTAETPTANETWREYRLVVAFRDDDIQPYYESSTMRAVDGIFVEEDVPVTNGVIPFTGETPITEADDTCQYLRERTREHPDTFEFALHGYTHENRTDFHGSSEFGGQPYETQLTWMQNGTAELVECTGERPTTFVPPMNTYDENTTRAAAETNYTTVSGGSWFTGQYYGEAPVFENGSVVHVASTNGYVKNWSSLETKSGAELKTDFDDAYAEGGTFVMMIHYPDFDTPEKRADLRALVRHAKSRDGVRFMTVGEIGSRVSNGTMERTDDGWRVLEAGR